MKLLKFRSPIDQFLGLFSHDIGIDLGTTNSCMAVMLDHAAASDLPHRVNSSCQYDTVVAGDVSCPPGGRPR